MAAKKCSPGPAKYTLPTTIGCVGHDVRKNRLPAYSFGLRLNDQDSIRSPAPNTYALQSTIGGRDAVSNFLPSYFFKCSYNDLKISSIISDH